jgi:hypothetical protein
MQYIVLRAVAGQALYRSSSALRQVNIRWRVWLGHVHHQNTGSKGAGEGEEQGRRGGRSGHRGGPQPYEATHTEDVREDRAEERRAAAREQVSLSTQPSIGRRPRSLESASSSLPFVSQ